MFRDSENLLMEGSGNKDFLTIKTEAKFNEPGDFPYRWIDFISFRGIIVILMLINGNY